MPTAHHNPPHPMRTASALVESPLQLLCTIEAHAAGLGGNPTRVHVRDDVPSLGNALDAVRGFGLPGGLSAELTGRRAALTANEPVWLVGDAFSGLFQATAPLRRGLTQVVLVDDGLATLDLARRIAEREPLIRPRATAGAARRSLGTVAARRLRSLAADGRATLFTALPLDVAVSDRLLAMGFELVRNTFSWLAQVPAADAPSEPTVVIGSALAGDGLIDADRYVDWVRSLAADGPLRYLPHRREPEAVLNRLSSVDGLVLDAAGAPVELRLRGMTASQRVVSLPSTAAVLLTTILAPAGVAVSPQAVPDSWWTDRATPSLRAHLSSVLRLAAETHAARTGPDSTNPEDHG
ncbi:hypothetical protein [Promicromonospora umidemergens]|uniref:hypothetical protein n=1 Tax=Promicromonospora umidemergens TaxID=629679 RepID=UPI0020A33FCF|nr:hypothetical protein [Promicromonospora umidemergens]